MKVTAPFTVLFRLFAALVPSRTLMLRILNAEASGKTALVATSHFIETNSPGRNPERAPPAEFALPIMNLRVAGVAPEAAVNLVPEIVCPPALAGSPLS